jgi:hypothetical protein
LEVQIQYWSTTPTTRVHLCIEGIIGSTQVQAYIIAALEAAHQQETNPPKINKIGQQEGEISTFP